MRFQLSVLALPAILLALSSSVNAKVNDALSRRVNASSSFDQSYSTLTPDRSFINGTTTNATDAEGVIDCDGYDDDGPTNSTISDGMHSNSSTTHYGGDEGTENMDSEAEDCSGDEEGDSAVSASGTAESSSSPGGFEATSGDEGGEENCDDQETQTSDLTSTDTAPVQTAVPVSTQTMPLTGGALYATGDVSLVTSSASTAVAQPSTSSVTTALTSPVSAGGEGGDCGATTTIYATVTVTQGSAGGAATSGANTGAATPPEATTSPSGVAALPPVAIPLDKQNDGDEDLPWCDEDESGVLEADVDGDPSATASATTVTSTLVATPTDVPGIGNTTAAATSEGSNGNKDCEDAEIEEANTSQAQPGADSGAVNSNSTNVALLGTGGLSNTTGLNSTDTSMTDDCEDYGNGKPAGSSSTSAILATISSATTTTVSSSDLARAPGSTDSSSTDAVTITAAGAIATGNRRRSRWRKH